MSWERPVSLRQQLHFIEHSLTREFFKSETTLFRKVKVDRNQMLVKVHDSHFQKREEFIYMKFKYLDLAIMFNEDNIL